MKTAYIRAAAHPAACLLALCGVLAAPVLPAATTAVAEANNRPALVVAHPERAVLQAVTKAGARLVAVGEHGIVLYSDDQGKSWQQARVPVSVTLTAVAFPTAKQGWAVGHFGMVLHSADGGQSWAVQLDGKRAAELVLSRAEAAARATGNNPVSDKALAEAKRLVADGPDKPFLDVHFTDAQHGLIVGAYGLAFITADGGANWQPILAQLDNPKANHLYAIAGVGQAVFLVGERGLVFRGDTLAGPYHRLTTPYEGSYFTVQADKQGNVLVAGLRGNAFRSADQGMHWDKVVLPSTASIVASAPDLKGGLLLANQAGQMLVSPDMGKTISTRPTPPLPPLTGMVVLDDGRVVATSLRGLATP